MSSNINNFHKMLNLLRSKIGTFEIKDITSEMLDENNYPKEFKVKYGWLVFGKLGEMIFVYKPVLLINNKLVYYKDTTDRDYIASEIDGFIEDIYNRGVFMYNANFAIDVKLEIREIKFVD